MPRDIQNKVLYFLPLLLIIAALIQTPIRADLSTLSNSDPYPVFKTIDPQDYLLTKEKIRYKNLDWVEKKRDRFGLYLSPFGQNADRGKTIRGENFFSEPPTNTPPSGIVPTGPQSTNTTVIVPLGDLEGRSSMIALLMGSFPNGKTGLAFYPGGENGFLAKAFTGLGLGPTFTPGQFNDQQYIDPQMLFGYFTFYLKYRKRGLRMQFDARLYKDFGLNIQTGVCNIRQVVEQRDDLTNNDNAPTQLGVMPNPVITNTAVDQYLMDEVNGIAMQMSLNIGNYVKTSFEEIRVNLFWRHAFEFNNDMDIEWPHFLVIPFIQASGSFSPGKRENPSRLWAVPFGNDGHESVGFTAGVNFDFIETIELGGEAGYTYFFKKSVSNFRVPTSQFQTTLFPFTTDVSIRPGANWYFGAKISVFHFVDKFSAYFEWFVLDHAKDSISLKNPDPAFLPGVLEQRSSFKVKFGNFGLNYDLSPNLGIGFMWQMPFSQRNAYRSSTIMAGVNATF